MRRRFPPVFHYRLSSFKQTPTSDPTKAQQLLAILANALLAKAANKVIWLGWRGYWSLFCSRRPRAHPGHGRPVVKARLKALRSPLALVSAAGGKCTPDSDFDWRTAGALPKGARGALKQL